MKTLSISAFFLLGAVCALAQYTLSDVRVTILDESGKPAKGATVHCVSWFSGPRAAPLQPDELSTTDANGIATFHAKSFRQSFVRVSHGKLGGWFRVHEDKDGASVGTFAIGLGRTVRGIVRDERGEPAPGVLVLVDGCLPATETDGKGVYAVPNIGIGYSHSFGFYKEGYAWSKEQPREDMNSVDVVLKKGFDIDGVVLETDEKPVPKADIFFSNQNDALQSGADGAFRIYGVAVGTHLRLNASLYREESRDSLFGAAEFDVGDTAPKPVRITMAVRPPAPPSEPKTIRGKVVRADTGKPVTSQMFMGSSAGNADSNPGATDPQGEFVIDNNVHSVHWISALPVNPTLYILDAPVRVDASNGNVDGVVLKASDGCAIRGRIVTEDGKPVAKRQVQVQPFSSFFPPIITRDDGRFSVGNLEPIDGTYRISMDDENGRNGSVEVGPLKKGELREGVELVLPAMKQPHVLRGTVRNEKGEPLPNIRVMLTYDKTPGKAHLNWPVTDDAGQFQIKVIEGGQLRISASTSVYVKRGGDRYDTQRFFRVVGDEYFELDASKDSDISIVLARQDIGVLQGRVTDASGAGVPARLQLVSGNDKKDYGSCDNDGYFAFQRAPEPPLLLEVMKDGYRAKVVPISAPQGDEDIAPLALTLQPGPFAIGESVWSGVTGLPATEEAVTQLPFAFYVRQRETEYYRVAAQKLETPEQSQKQPQSFFPKLHVVDGQGKPIDRIFMLPVQSLYTPEMAIYMPARGYAPKSIPGVNGVFDPIAALQGGVSYGWVLWAEGMGKVSGYLEQKTDPNAVVDIVLRPECTIKFNVFDESGKPAADIPVCAPELAWETRGDNTEPRKIGVTDHAGKLRLEHITPGTHAFAVGSFNKDRRYVSVAIGEGEAKTVPVKLTTDPSDVDWLLQTWRMQQDSNSTTKSDEVDKAIAEITPTEKTKAVSAVRAALAAAIDLSPNVRAREYELTLMSSMARRLDDKDAIPVLQRVLEGLEDVRRGGRVPRYTGIGSAAQSLVGLQGEASVPFFEAVASNPTRSAIARLAAIEALGVIGTKASAGAFARIRDAVRNQPGAPPAKESYTHSERIKETIDIVQLLTNGSASPYVAVESSTTKNISISISEDYSTADVWVSFPYGGTNFKMVRIGDEWLIHEFGGTAMA